MILTFLTSSPARMRVDGHDFLEQGLNIHLLPIVIILLLTLFVTAVPLRAVSALPTHNVSSALFQYSGEHKASAAITVASRCTLTDVLTHVMKHGVSPSRMTSLLCISLLLLFLLIILMCPFPFPSLPTITQIDNQTLPWGIPQMRYSTPPLPFQVGDGIDNPISLTVKATSSNSNLVPEASIYLIGPNNTGQCTVRVVPNGYMWGQTTITLIVTNPAGISARTSFTLTIEQPPTIWDIDDQTIYVVNPSSTQYFSVGDNITAPGSLTVTASSSDTTLIPNANIQIQGTDAVRSVTVTPALGLTGQADITLTVIDGSGLSTTGVFTITVIAKNPVDGADLVWVPDGSFIMGSSLTNDDASQGETQQVTLSGYWMYMYPVTVAQYRAFCAARPRTLPPYPSTMMGYGPFTPWSQNVDWTGTADNLQQTPIVNVTWNDCSEYAMWAGVSLPTEAQYEYAARGTAENNFPWGGIATADDLMNGWDDTKCANLSNSEAVDKSTWPVGSFPAGASWCGVQDLAGNVWEWCADWYGDYAITPVTNPTGPTMGAARVLRGGSWGGNDGGVCRGAFRIYISIPDICDCRNGFRCVFNPSAL